MLTSSQHLPYINALSRKQRMKKILIIVLIVLGSAFAYGYYLYHKPHQGLANKQASFAMTSKELFTAYDQNEDNANQKYLGKIVSVTGRVADKAMDAKGTFSVILEGGEMAGVGCQFDKKCSESDARGKKRTSGLL